MVRRAAALNISNIVELADVETIKAEFIPILDNLIKDPQVRIFFQYYCSSLKLLYVDFNSSSTFAHLLS